MEGRRALKESAVEGLEAVSELRVSAPSVIDELRVGFAGEVGGSADAMSAKDSSSVRASASSMAAVPEGGGAGALLGFALSARGGRLEKGGVPLPLIWNQQSAALHLLKPLSNSQI
jgi:hypothetical protein